MRTSLPLGVLSEHLCIRVRALSTTAWVSEWRRGRDGAMQSLRGGYVGLLGEELPVGLRPGHNMVYHTDHREKEAHRRLRVGLEYDHTWGSSLTPAPSEQQVHSKVSLRRAVDAV